MSRRRSALRITVMLAAMLALLCATGAAADGGVFTEFSGTETCVPVPGSLTIVMHGGNMHFAESYDCVDTASIPEASGTVQVSMKGVFDAATFAGPFTASAHFTNAEGGWIEWATGSLGDGVGSMRSHGRGEGAYEGMQAWWECTWPVSMGNLEMTCAGRILDPHK